MSSSDRPHAGRTSAFSVPQPGWTLTHRRAEVADILRREFEARADKDQEAEYDPRPVGALYEALDHALAIEEAAEAAVRPILSNREIQELLAERFGKRESDK